MTIKDKFNRIELSALPKEYQAELKQIKDDTENFSDQDLIDVYQDNFDTLWSNIERRYPEAIKAKKKLKIKKEQPKPKKKLVIKKKQEPSEPIGSTGKDYDLSGLNGKRVAFHFMGQDEPAVLPIENIKVSDKKYDKRDVTIEDRNGGYSKFPLSQLQNFLEGKEVSIKGEKEEYAIELLDKSDADCEAALTEIKAIHAKREAAAQKRADAPKRQPQTLAAERQVVAFKHAIHTSDLKGDDERAMNFAKDLAKIYRKYGMESVADKILEAAKKKISE